MAPSVAARGKIYAAVRRGETTIPADWALGPDGKPTTDPMRALEPGSVMLPIGGPKGAALAVLMDVFSGVLTGAAFGGDVKGPYDVSGPGDVGHFVMVIKPDLFVSADEFKDRMKTMYDRVVGADKMEGVDRIYFPGELELETEEERRRDGIPFVQEEIKALNEEAEKVGVQKLRLASTQ
jgi:LDH2 family malate/lactate/ureidoglycolate dehydrogenase